MASVNAAPDLYALTMVLQYDSNNNNQTARNTLTTTAGIFVGGQTDFDVAFSQSDQGQTSLSVANIGITPAYSTTVVIPQQDGWRVNGNPAAIVGNLDKGDYTLVSFQITPTGDNAGQQNAAQGTQTTPRTGGAAAFAAPRTLHVQVMYTDTTGARRTVDKDVLVQFRPATTGTTGTGATGTGTRTGAGGGQFGQRGAPAAASTTQIVIAVLFILALLGGAAYFQFKKRGQ
jgi:hypothetical protein